MTITAFTGTSRTEYISWVKTWKSEYKALSAEIRSLKAQRKEKIWAYRPAGSSASIRKRTATSNNPNYNPNAAYEAQRLSVRATELLEFRKEAKEIAQQQYAARLVEAA